MEPKREYMLVIEENINALQDSSSWRDPNGMQIGWHVKSWQSRRLQPVSVDADWYVSQGLR